MFKTYFSPEQLYLLVPSTVLILLSIFFFQTGKRKVSIFLLVSGAFGIRIFAAMLDPFLNTWDEQFHALVAKNMLVNPFQPMLYTDNILPYDYRNWVGNHIWLHKQPLFLWQMALSFKIFGLNEFSVRVPSIIMSTILVLLIYRIGKLVLNARVGYCSALLFTLAYYQINLVAGSTGMDHNNLAFVFYITSSIWAWVEYYTSHKTYWLLLIGMFSGMAILVKWMVGLLVYAGWGCSILFIKESRNQIVYYKEIGISVLVTILVFLPWQIYIINTFPIESSFEYSFNNRHLYEVVEDHAGNF